MIAHIWFLRERERILGIIRDAWTVSIFLRECILQSGIGDPLTTGEMSRSEDEAHVAGAKQGETAREQVIVLLFRKWRDQLQSEAKQNQSKRGLLSTLNWNPF